MRGICNLYSLTKRQPAIRGLFRAKHDGAGNLPLFPSIFPDQLAPIVRVGADGERELVIARWGMPGPLQFGGAPITNIRMAWHWDRSARHRSSMVRHADRASRPRFEKARRRESGFYINARRPFGALGNRANS